MTRKTFKYRLYPTLKQEKTLEQTLTTCRYLYNNALDERIETYKISKKSLFYADQAKLLTENKNEHQIKVYSQVLQDVLKRLDMSFKNFFRRINEQKKGKRIKAGFPRFKSVYRYNSFCYPQLGFRLTNDNKRIHLSKIGNIKLIYSRPIEGKIKTCRVLRDVDQWFIVLTCEFEDKQVPSNGKPIVGIDVGIKTLAVLSDGIHIENPRTLKKSEQKLHREQRRLSRKLKGSQNRNKQRAVVAKVHRKIRRQRTDFLHKLSTRLVQNYGLIVFEDLNIQGLLRNHKVAKLISDASWSQLILLTSSKAASAGSRVELVDPRNTSQNCSGCGVKVSKTLSDRIHCCPNCGLTIDRDDNASINIKRRAGIAQTDELNSSNAYGDATSTLWNANLKQVASLK